MNFQRFQRDRTALDGRKAPVHQGQVWANSQQLGYILEALSLTMPMRWQDARGIDLLSKREESVVRQVAEGMNQPRDIRSI